MKQSAVPIVGAFIILAIGLGLGYALWGAPVAAGGSRPTSPDRAGGADQETSGARDAGDASATADGRPLRPRRVSDADPVNTWRPKIRPGDEHPWETCADEHRDFVADEIAHPSIYVPRKTAQGRRFMLRWPEQIGLHMHLLAAAADGKSWRTLSTHWPTDPQARDEVLTHITPDVDVLLVVVPPSVQSYGVEDEVGQTAYEVTIPPTVVAFTFGRTEAAGLRHVLALGAAGMTGSYALTPVSQTWFALSMFGVRDLEASSVRFGDTVLPSVFSAGVEHDDGTYSWFFAFPWPRTMLLEQAMAQMVDLDFVDVSGRKYSVGASAPAKPQISIIEPNEPHKTVVILAALYGDPGTRYHAGFWAWPERRLREKENGQDGPKGADGAAGVDDGPRTSVNLLSDLWEFAPTAQEDRIQKKEISVSRESSDKDIGMSTMKLCPLWPQ
ncbi:MAG: hypothetical protein A3F84_20865 [Candidatus Handelsmanbacteria bacterium RIFCSPLOWO2_12_FULL_64_10]|uniref:Uncharacterized protein n=1 Tax=Handelsmanbacteria sp. (strain RIFCSPLOWO2_12_FULL_64_10) TaxID=1817868 RepID=A0A1F6D4W7_HANXR|nr:MAG: hypothetical protein A3F84_20865 [Candidatus Handelsmanbacteria bacterium RIFCSPLOWO2_12_FULL_64_10]